MTTTDELTATDADMLRRAAAACRNVAPDAEWFQWVPRHLARLADRIDVGKVSAAPDREGRGRADG